MSSGIRDVASSLDWGSIPEWVGAVFTSAAVMVAAITYRRSRVDAHVSQARRVSVIPDDYQRVSDGGWVLFSQGSAEAGVLGIERDDELGVRVRQRCVFQRVTVINNSHEDVSGLLVELKSDDPGFPRIEYGVAAMPPGRSETVSFVVADRWYSGGIDFGVRIDAYITFTDSAGTHWNRRGSEPVREQKNRSPFIPMWERGIHTVTYSDEIRPTHLTD